MCLPHLFGLNFGRNGKKKERERYIFQHDNKLKVLGLLEHEFSKVENLDLTDIGVWICDGDLTVVFSTFSSVNKLDPSLSVGKNIYDVQPKDLAAFCGDLHKRAQDAKEPVKLNVTFNGKLLFIVAEPILFLDRVVASALIIIPYKEGLPCHVPGTS